MVIKRVGEMQRNMWLKNEKKSKNGLLLVTAVLHVATSHMMFT